MKLIPLSQDRYALVDDADYGWLSRFKWNAEKVGKSRTFYASMGWGPRGSRRTIRMHQLVFPDADEVDHINRNGLNNSRSNLRASTKSQNAGNMAKWNSSNCTSRFKGVCFLKGRKKHPWLARAGSSHIGTFPTEIEAAMAYDKAALVAFGEFARINFPAGDQSPALGQR